MVNEIRNDVRETSSYIDRDKLDPRVMQAMLDVPRHEFVPEHYTDSAYANQPLPIGHGQTISQPYIVALMTDLLNPQSRDRVLEIGTGSGYQAAVLSGLVSEVFSIEIVEPLADMAKERLERLGYENIRLKTGDGYYGWPDEEPFDGIVVTAAASHIPPPLIEQLKPGGRMVIPVGSRFTVQQLILVEKTTTGKTSTRQMLPVRFVPLTGGNEN
ncbi:MAG: protein-L-isoaspartate(D-aspartate) O-methyltransferase [Gammaproteobacteria bacterium]|nr:MAG: protein-L-isoaspartate(D-aspartate) O-methyltransferase [Gammaproteobacteria bacterium]